MRLVAWNAYVGSKKARTVAECLAFLRPLHADIVVLSEGPIAPSSGVWSWPLDQGAPRLHVWASPAYSITPVSLESAPPRQSGLFTIAGPASFTLSAIWPVQVDGGHRYSRLLAETLDLHADALKAGDAILAGDLNSSPGVSGQVAAHRRFVDSARSIELVSAFHHQEGVNHGEETTGTFRRGKTNPKQYHLDYCFVSCTLAPAATLAIIKNKEWSDRSDHWPLVLDIPNERFGASGK